MIVTIPIKFNVESNEDEKITMMHAREAAEMAAYDYLAFCEISGYSGSTESVEVHVEGFGKCSVRMPETS
jgi:hypothetical protein